MGKMGSWGGDCLGRDGRCFFFWGVKCGKYERMGDWVWEGSGFLILGWSKSFGWVREGGEDHGTELCCKCGRRVGERGSSKWGLWFWGILAHKNNCHPWFTLPLHFALFTYHHISLVYFKPSTLHPPPSPPPSTPYSFPPTLLPFSPYPPTP
jgi:hypothetical protein